MITEFGRETLSSKLCVQQGLGDFQAGKQMEVRLELKYKFGIDPFELRQYAVGFDLTDRVLGGPQVLLLSSALFTNKTNYHIVDTTHFCQNSCRGRSLVCSLIFGRSRGMLISLWTRVEQKLPPSSMLHPMKEWCFKSGSESNRFSSKSRFHMTHDAIFQ